MEIMLQFFWSKKIKMTRAADISIKFQKHSTGKYDMVKNSQIESGIVEIRKRNGIHAMGDVI